MESKNINEVFDFGRFRHYLSEYFRDKRKELVPYGISTVAMLVIFAIGNLHNPTGRNADVWSYTPIFYFIILCMCVGISSRAFVNLDTVNGSLTELTTPASQLEKFLSKWIVTVLLPLVFCLCVMKGVEIVALKAVVYHYTSQWALPANDIELMKPLFTITGSWLISIVWLQAIFFLGSVGWRKYSALKTLAVLTMSLILAISVWGNYMPWLAMDISPVGFLLLLAIIPLCLYHASWVLYRRAQVK